MTTQTESFPRTAMEVTPADFTALNAYSIRKSNLIASKAGKMCQKNQKRLQNLQNPRIGGICEEFELSIEKCGLTNLEETTFRREDGNVTIIASSASTTHDFFLLVARGEREREFSACFSRKRGMPQGKEWRRSFLTRLRMSSSVLRIEDVFLPKPTPPPPAPTKKI